MKRAKHSLSNYKLFSANMGNLIPVGMQDVIAGDTFNHRTSLLIRMSPMLAPVMHPVTVRLHHFFVPYRLVFEGWEDFITGANPDVEIPDLAITESDGIGSLADYLGVPPPEEGWSYQVNGLPFRAYNLIFNEFYRDQDLVSEVGLNSKSLQRVAWEKDYFTSSRPWAQKGPEITLPLGERAPIRSQGISDVGTNEWVPHQPGIAPTVPPGETDYEFDDVYADLSKAEQIDIREFRAAFALQRYQEARARYGSRYTEYLAYLGVRAADQRLQRPEYLGGGKQTISFSEILQTAPDETAGSFGVGDMYGHGISAMRSNRYRKFFPEHGVVLSLMSVRPKSIYVNGLPRKFSRTTKEDYWQRELQHVGAQEVKSKEVFADATAEDEEVFGYQDRYREYREEPSQVAREFRDELDYWHLGRKFDTRPALNDTFIACNPSDRIYNVADGAKLWCMAYHSIQARRLVARNASIGRIV